MRPSDIRNLILLAGLTLLWPLTGTATATVETVTCEGSDITVSAPDPELAGSVCEVAHDHAARLATCGIHQSRPISISIVPSIEGFPANCVGAFHCATDEIEIVPPQALAEREAPDSIYRGLTPETAFVSILRHELTHAFAEHTTEDDPISNAAHEYIAFAFQIDAMSGDERAAFLATNGKRPAKSLDTFNIYIYGLLPGPFASAVWIHYNSPENGCDFIERLLTGSISLGLPRLEDPSSP